MNSKYGPKDIEGTPASRSLCISLASDFVRYSVLFLWVTVKACMGARRFRSFASQAGSLWVYYGPSDAFVFCFVLSLR